jgi:hypothetical protein
MKFSSFNIARRAASRFLVLLFLLAGAGLVRAELIFGRVTTHAGYGVANVQVAVDLYAINFPYYLSDYYSETTTDINGYYTLGVPNNSATQYGNVRAYRSGMSIEPYIREIETSIFYGDHYDYNFYVSSYPAPNFTAPSNATVPEDNGSTVTVSGITRGDNGLNMTLGVTASSSNPSVVPNPTVAYASPNASATLTFAAVPNVSGVSTITVNLARQDGYVVTKTFTYTVSAVNDAPQASPATALLLNGGSSGSIPALDLANKSFSIEFWNRRTRINSWDIYLFQGAGAVNQGLHVGFRPENGFTFAFYGNDLTTPSYIDLNWHHWACTYDAVTRTRKIYRDGVEVAGDIAAANFQGSGAISIASNQFGSYGRGEIADLRIWNTARTAAEIQQNRNRVLPRLMPNLFVNYRFNEGSGLVATDLAQANSFPEQGGVQNATLPADSVFTVYPATPGKYIRLNRASNQTIRVPNFGALLPDSDVTFEFWQKVDAKIQQSSFSVSNPSGESANAHVPWEDGRVYWDYGNINAAEPNNGRLFYTPSVAITNSWQHFAFVSDAAGMKIYRNGALESSKATRGKYLTKSGDLTLQPGGRIADFRVWNMARSAAQIATNRFGRVAPESSNLILNFLFEETSGSTVADSATAAGAQNGTIENGAAFSDDVIELGGTIVADVMENSTQVISLPGADVDSTISYTGINAGVGSVNPSALAYGNFLYTPRANFTGSDSVTYIVTDGSLASTSAVRIAVNALNDPPVVGPGTSISLNGANQYLDAPDGVWFGSTYTVEGWVFVRSYANWSRLFDFGNGSSSDNVLGALSQGTTGRPHFAVHKGGAEYSINSSDAIPLNTWTHLAFAYDGTTARIFINGVQTASGAIPVPANVNRVNNYFGRSNWGGDAYADAKFADLRVWNVARDAAQIKGSWSSALPSDTAGLVAHYRLNEGGSEIAIDSAAASGNQLATVLGKPVWHPADGPVNSITLGGSGQYVETLNTAAIALAGNITLEAWVRPENNVAGPQGIIEKYGTTQGGYLMRLESNGKVSMGTTEKTGTYSGVTSLGTIPSKVWTHVAGTWDGFLARIYINGVLDNYAVSLIGPKAGVSPLYIGAVGDNQGYTFNGRIGDARVWNVARTDAQVSAFRAGVAANTPGLVVNYLMNDGSTNSPSATLVNVGSGGTALNGSVKGVAKAYGTIEPTLATAQTMKYTEDTTLKVALPAYDIEGNTLAYSGVTVTSGSLAQVSAGVYNYTPTANINAPAVINYTVSDGTTSVSSKVYLEGIPVEDPPTLAAISDITISEGAPTASINLAVTDGDPELTQTLSVVATSSNPNLIRNPRIDFPNQSAPPVLNYKPQAGMSGSAVITVVVTESPSLLTATRTFAINVTQVNDSPNVGPATALSFNGTNYARIPNFGLVMPTDEITIEYWQKNLATTDQYGFAFGNNANNNRVSAHVPYGDNKIYWDFGDISGGGRLSYSPPVSIIGSWQHFAFVASRSGNYMKIYRNGIEEATKPGVSTITPGSSELRLGLFNGQMSEFRVWKVARTGDEILGGMHSALPNGSANLVAYYRFNQRPTLTLVDFADGGGQGGAQNGELVAASTPTDEIDPSWLTSFTQGLKTYQVSVAELALLQKVNIPDGTSTNVFLPAWNPENSDTFVWTGASADFGAVTQVNGGLWTYYAPTGYSGNATITYTVSDSVATNPSVSSSIKVRVVVAQNDPPTISVIPNKAAEEDSTLIEIPFQVTDDQPASALTITVVPLVNAELLQSFSVPAGQNYRVLNVVPKPGVIGTVHLSIQVTDAGNKSARVEFDLRIEPKPAFSIVDLGLIPGKSTSFGTAINDRGAVAGFMADTGDLQSNPLGFFYNGLENGGTLSQVGPSPMISPFKVFAMNNSYSLAGSASSLGKIVAWNKGHEGEIFELGTLTGTFAEARAMHPSGKVVGNAKLASGKYRAFSRQAGDSALINLGTALAPFDVESEAFAINISNRIAGAVSDAAGNRRAMLLADGNMRPLLSIPDDTNSVALGINAFDQVVGRSETFAAGDTALAFDGSNDQAIQTNLNINLTGANLPAGNADHTVEAWVKINSRPVAQRTWPLLLGNPVSGNHHWIMNTGAAGKLQVGIWNGGAVQLDVSVGAWMHVAASYNSGNNTISIYRNGELVSSLAAGTVNLQGLPLKLGTDVDGAFFHGALDEVRVWRTARTASQISANYNQRLVGTETGLVAYFPFDEASGSIATSKALGGLVATMTGSPAREARGGLPAPNITVSEPALQFDGVGSKVNLPSFALANNSFTLELWARRAGTGAEEYLIAQGATDTANQRLRVGFTSGNNFKFSFFNNELVSSAAYTNGDWHHWAVTYDATNKARKIFLDGVQVASDTAPANYTGSGAMTLGQIGTNWFKGAMDDVRVWNVVRTQPQIASNLNTRLAPNTANLVGYYLFDEGGGATTVNRATGASDASLQGAINWAGRDTGSSRAFLYESLSGRLNSLGTVPGGGDSVANGINDFGQIVGSVATPLGQRAFFHSAGKLNVLNDLLPEIDTDAQWVLETGNAINRSGAIAGSGSLAGVKRAFLALPATVIGRPVIVPEGAIAKYPQITILKKHREDDTVLNSFTWSPGEKRLYAIRPVTAKIEWYVTEEMTSGTGTNLVFNTNRIVSVSVNIWPQKPRIHIAGAPVDLQPAFTGANYTFQSLAYVTNNASVEPSQKVFTSPTPGYTVAHYIKNDGLPIDPTTQPFYFEVVRTVTWNDSHAEKKEQNWTIGQEVVDPAHAEYDGKNGYVLFEKAAYDAVGPDRAYDRGTRLGPILPVNITQPGGNTNANSDNLVVVWYRTNRIGVAWASVPVNYRLTWPADSVVDKIVIASLDGSGVLDDASYPAKTIYNQPDITLPGFNPNEEHALMPAERLYAIRDDLNAIKNYSLPYALLKFRDSTTSRWRMRVFKVVAEDANNKFRYTGTVGKEVQPPIPLNLLPLSSQSYWVNNTGVTPVGFKDVKGKIYAQRAGPDGTHADLVMRWFYPMQPGFFHPDNVDSPGSVPAGQSLALLDRTPSEKLSSPNQSGAISGTPIKVTYDIHWDATAILQIGETLVHSKRGLPDVFNMANARVIFDSLATTNLGGVGSTARFYDPISSRTLTEGVVIPSSLRRQNIGGKEYFIDLPWFLKTRLSYDPINNWLSFTGLLDENFSAGEPLLLPNVLTSREKDRIANLDPNNSAWRDVVFSLYELTRNPNKIDYFLPNDGKADKAFLIGYQYLTVTNFFEVPVEHREYKDVTVSYPVYDPDTGDVLGYGTRVEKQWVWVNDTRKKPTSLDEALATDAKVIRDLQVRGESIYRITGDDGHSPVPSSYSITKQLAPEVLNAGPKVLTTGFGGTPAAAAKPGNALRFYGTNGIVTLGTDGLAHLNLAATPFTIEFWAKVTDPKTNQYIFSQASGPGDLGKLRLGFRDGGKFAFDLGTNGASLSIFNTGDVYTDTNWHHWAAAFDSENKTQTIYRDGAVVASRTNAALNYVGSGVAEIGRYETNNFVGQLDEFRIWTTARTATQIRAQMNKRQLGAGVEPNLEVLYRFDEAGGSTTVASDALTTPTSFAGTLSGSVDIVASGAIAGIPPRYITIAENNDASLGGLPVALHVIRIDDGPFLGDLKVLPGDNVFDERLTMRHSSDFGGDPDPITFQWYYKPIGPDFNPTDLPVVNDPEATSPSDMRGWILYSGFNPPTGAGVNYVTIGEGGESGLITLSDNAFVCRYKGYPVNLNSANAWSGWVGDPSGTPEQPRAALAEGWVKRVIRGLNPFDARTADFHSSPSVTFASMLIQAGRRYEGPIAFNPSADAINKVGLIEAYSTVQDRARGLSIDGVPSVDFNPANNAILLAATKISDLYTLIGNEAYADASDPTIGFGSGSKDYGSLASSIFAFQNQLDSLLEEELVLLRGRDDSAAGVGANPVYNRLFWNFTLGEGEVAYQQNYNVSDQDINGFIDEKDARILYPQGHGDAWGHYLMAIKQHYTLLRHPKFTWIPRTEFVVINGVANKVDFLDERKFAATAAAKARAGAEIVDLTYRLNYVDDPAGQWQGYKDSKTDRAWGVTEWARRAGTGAYFDWLTANTILPSEDPNPAHIGIDKIDRQTVGELKEISAHFDEIQTKLDQADAGLNPIGLAKGVVPFDIDPSLVSGGAGIAGKTHYEQIQDRALKSMLNATAVWDEVNKATEALRRNQDSVEQLTANVTDQERDYKNRLIEIFGYPYAGDIGAGKTYPSSYDGPDIYHYMYVPVPDFDGVRSPFLPDATAYFTRMNLGVDINGNTQSGAFGDSSRQFFFPDDFAAELQNSNNGLNISNHIFSVVYPRTSDRYGFNAPASWGVRRAPGEIQMALSDLIQSEARLRAGLKADDALFAEIDDKVKLLSARYDLRAEELKLKSDLTNVKISFATAIIAAKAAEANLTKAGEFSEMVADTVQEALPQTVGLASDVTAPGRSALKATGMVLKQGTSIGATIAGTAALLLEKIGLPAAEGIVQSKLEAINFDYEIRKQVDELERLLRQVAQSRLEGIRLAEAVNQAGGRHLAALAKGQRLIEERVAYRIKVAGRTTENRYQDMTFRVFRNDALQKYRATFDLAQRYVFLAATAYDYESNLLGTDTRGGRNFLTDIIRQRALGQVLNGSPVVGRSGLADPLARMGNNFDVLKTQLGFNNPQTETGRFSLRNELFRLGDASDVDWRASLRASIHTNLWDVPEFRRYCRSFAPESAGAQPGIVIRFPTSVMAGQNFFGKALGGGDSAYDPSRFATKIRSAGLWFKGYNGLGLSQTPRIYLVPAGADILSSPTPNDFVTRGWRVVDQALPVPFPIGANRLRDPAWIPINDSLGGSFAEVRRFSSFRAYHDSGDFNPNEVTSDSRLIGRSVANTDWILIIPGQTFLANANQGLDRFIASVTDIKLFFQTYSYSGN